MTWLQGCLREPGTEKSLGEVILQFCLQKPVQPPPAPFPPGSPPDISPSSHQPVASPKTRHAFSLGTDQEALRREGGAEPHTDLNLPTHPQGFLDGASGKESTCKCRRHETRDTRDTGLIPGLGRSPGEGNGNPLQYSCLGNPMDRGACQATVHGLTKSWT